jgi:hypothetical protein
VINQDWRSMLRRYKETAIRKKKRRLQLADAALGG